MDIDYASNELEVGNSWHSMVSFFVGAAIVLLQAIVWWSEFNRFDYYSYALAEIIKIGGITDFFIVLSGVPIIAMVGCILGIVGIRRRPKQYLAKWGVALSVIGGLGGCAVLLLYVWISRTQ